MPSGVDREEPLDTSPILGHCQLHAAVGPAEEGRHEGGDAGRHGDSVVPGLEGEMGATHEDVGDGTGILGLDGMHDVGADVRQGADETRGERCRTSSDMVTSISWWRRAWSTAGAC